MQTKSKAETFIGFCVKSGKCKLGFNSVETLKKAKLLILCRSTEENSKKQAIKLKNRFNCPLLITTDKNLEDYVYKPNVKIMAITDNALKDAVFNNKGNELTEYSGE